MTSPHEILQPEGWPRPVGYANGVAAAPGRMVFVAGQVGWDAGQRFPDTGLAAQFEQALENVLAVVARAGGRPEHLCRITVYCLDKEAYMKARAEMGRIWRHLVGRHYPAMSLIFVAGLVDDGALIELEATAVVPEG